MDIPARWEDVTAGWMTEALADRFAGSVVERVTLVARHDGSNRRARFHIAYSSGTGPEMVFLKAEGHPEVHARNENMFNEPQLFASGVPLPVEHPDAYTVLMDPPGLNWLLVMEDVTARGADPRDATRPLTVDQVASGLSGLARLHRAYWNLPSPPQAPLAWLQTWEPTEGFQHGLLERVPTGMERAGDRLPSEVAACGSKELVDLWARYVALLGRGPATLLHADAHIGNTYVLPGNEVGFLDWQVARRGNSSQDFGYFLQGALVESDRRTHERDLLETYRRQLGSRLSPDEGWRWYRASAIYGLVIWLSTLGSDAWQPRDVCLALVDRYAASFVELDSLAALEASE